MRKKGMALCLCLALSLGLAACGAEEPEEPPVKDPVPQKETETELAYYLEGEETRLPAVLYEGEGYELFIPKEGWLRETGDEEGFASVSWEPEVNDDVELEVITLTGMTLAQAQDWVRAEEDDYELLEDKRGGLGGLDQEDRMNLEVRFYETEEAVYALACQYPLEAAEGFGVTLSVVADTFQITK